MEPKTRACTECEGEGTWRYYCQEKEAEVVEQCHECEGVGRVKDDGCPGYLEG